MVIENGSKGDGIDVDCLSEESLMLVVLVALE